MTETINERICRSCAGCCQRGTAIPVTAEEAGFISEGGGEICILIQPPRVVEAAGQISSADSINSGEGKIILVDDCGWLKFENGKYSCAAYEDPRRPQACADFDMGSPGCERIREFRGMKPLAIPILNNLPVTEAA